MADRLAALMTHFPMRAQVFKTGPLCGINTLQSDGVHGQLHLIRRGEVEVRYGRETLHVTQPSLLLFPRPLTHRFITAPDREVDMVCANLTFEGGSANPIASALADLVCLPLDGVWGAEPVLSLLFEEAFEQRCGRMALVERLVEVVMIQILRQLMESDEVSGGLLSGLAHPRLRNALVAMHEAPAQDWTLDNLAGVAGMSRSAFATTFRESRGDGAGGADAGDAGCRLRRLLRLRGEGRLYRDRQQREGEGTDDGIHGVCLLFVITMGWINRRGSGLRRCCRGWHWSTGRRRGPARPTPATRRGRCRGH